MSRTLAAGMLTAIQAASNRPVLFFEGVFSTGTVRFWTGYGSKSWDSQTWTGAGHLLGISPVEETTELKARKFSVACSGIPSSLVTHILTNTQQGLNGKVWLGALDSSEAVIADPFLAFWGRLDVPSIEDAGETCVVRITYESRLIRLQTPNERRYTHEDQQIDFAGDLGFEYVEDPQDKRIIWA